MVYFTSDLHFGHAGIITSCNRPFDTVEEMDSALERLWNGVVTKRDEIYVLGDFTMKSPAVANEYLSRLNGRKYLIRGNHDKFTVDFEAYENSFVWIKDYYVLNYNKRKFVLFHYPIAEWDGYYRDAIHLYGHIHNSAESASRIDASGLSFNVGVDCNDFKPVSIDDVILMAEIRSS